MRALVRQIRVSSGRERLDGRGMSLSCGRLRVRFGSAQAWDGGADGLVFVHNALGIALSLALLLGGQGLSLVVLGSLGLHGLDLRALFGQPVDVRTSGAPRSCIWNRGKNREM